MAGVFGNPMQLVWPLGTYVQPGAPAFGNVDPGQDEMVCIIDGLTGRRIGSTCYDWRCPNAHQWHYEHGQITFLGQNYPYFVTGPPIVPVVRDPRS
jgi:hypothetical protein